MEEKIKQTYAERKKRSEIYKSVQTKVEPHITHYQQYEINTGRLVYDRYKVHWGNRGKVQTDRYFERLEDAREYNSYCTNLYNKITAHKEVGFEIEDTFDEFPENLLKEIGITDEREDYYDVILPNFDKNFEILSQMVNERYISFIVDKYKRGFTLEKIANDNGITASRAKQIIAKGIRILKHPTRKGVLFSSIEKRELVSMQEKEEMLAQIKQEMTLDVAMQVLTDNGYHFYCLRPLQDNRRRNIDEEATIADLELSVRTYNCCIRAGLRKLTDFFDITIDDLTSLTGNLYSDELR